MINFPGYFIKSDFPQHKQIVDFAVAVKNHLFPVIENVSDFVIQQNETQDNIKSQLKDLLLTKRIAELQDSEKIILSFIDSLTLIKQMLMKDALFFLESDPAASSAEEIILSYPGFLSITMHRIAHVLFLLNVPLIPRMIAEWSHSETGIDINPGAKIGCPFFIDHGTGVVIGETSVIGNSVKIYQGVTLGALVVNKSEAQQKRHPTIENNVIIYAGSTILGGKTVIGHDSIIGGNTWITESVAPFSIVYHKNQTVIADRNHRSEPISFVI